MDAKVHRNGEGDDSVPPVAQRSYGALGPLIAAPLPDHAQDGLLGVQLAVVLALP